MTFKDWLFGSNYSGWGDYSYKAIHLISLGVVLALAIALIFIGKSKKISDKVKNIILYSLAISALVFEVTWRIVFYFRGDKVLSMWPFYPCNLAGIVVPIAVLCKSDITKKIFYVFSVFGGILTFAEPSGIFPLPVMTFPILKSVLQHTFIILIPVFELARGSFKIKIKDLPLMLFGIIVHLFNSEVMSVALEQPGDYMYLRSTLPFVIPGVPQFITLGVPVLLVLIGVYFLADIKSVKNWHKQRKARKIIEKTKEEEPEMDFNELFQ